MLPNVEYIKTLVNGLKEFVNSKIKLVRKDIDSLPQADWNQNDSAAKDYVKNRTHYVERQQTSIAGAKYTATYDGTEHDPLPFALGQVWSADFETTSYDNLEVKQTSGGTLYIGDLNVNQIPFYVTKTSGGHNSSWANMAHPGELTLTGVSGTVEDVTVHTLDPKYIGTVTNEILSIPVTQEFAADAWANDFSYFTDSWLAHNASKYPISIEINGKMFQHLPYSAGSYGAFTFGNVNTIGVEITNSGRGTSIQNVNVSFSMFPEGITRAKVYRTVPLRIPEEALPENVEWITRYKEDDLVKIGNRVYVRDNEAMQVIRENYAPNFDDFEESIRDMVVIITTADTSYYDLMGKNTITAGYGNGATYERNVYLSDGTAVTESDWPLGCALLGRTWSTDLVLLNPRTSRNLILSSSTPNSAKKFKIAVDDSGALSAVEVTE